LRTGLLHLRSLAKDTAIYGGADLLTKAVAFFTFPLIAAALSPRAFGALELIGTATALLGLAMNCGLNNSVQRYYWDKDTTAEQRPVIVSTGISVQLVFGVVITALSLLLVPFIYPFAKTANLPLTWIALAAAVFLMTFSQWSQYALDVIRLHFVPWVFLSVSIINRIFVAIAGVLVVVVLRCGVDGLLSAQALVSLAVLPLAFFFIRKDLTRHIDMRWAKELVRFGYPFIFAGMAYWLFTSMDRWMLAAMSSVDEVGIYSVASRFATLVLFVSTAFAQAWSPAAIKIRTDHPDTYRKFYADVLLLLLFVMLAVGGGLALFSGELIHLMMPKVYQASSLPLVILCLGVVFQASQQITSIGISLEKKSLLLAQVVWVTALINFLLNFILIPHFGAAGAATATTISYLFLSGSYLYFTQKLHSLPISWKRLAAMLFLGGCIWAIALTKKESNLQWNIIVLKVLAASACAGCAWFLLPVRKLSNATPQ
jgi:O-antigen/teichoic acid export membrane protein